MIEAAFQQAKASGKYDLVKTIGGQNLRAYAMYTSYEYFAESTESFFTSKKFWNDYYPFINSELKTFDIAAWNMVAQVFGVDGSKYLSQMKFPEQICLDMILIEFKKQKCT